MDKGKKFWKCIYDMHLYDTKAEGIFKAVLITFSWIGGVNMITLPDTMDVTIAASLFLFSTALIMEYIVKLVITEKFSTRIFPAIIVFISIVCAFKTFGTLVGRPFKIEFECLYNMTILPQLVIWLDVLVQLMINKPEDMGIETSLKKVEVDL